MVAQPGREQPAQPGLLAPRHRFDRGSEALTAPGLDLHPDDDATPATPGAAFVTLTLDGHLRGCIGSLTAHRPLAEDVTANALAAAFDDPRFPPLTAAEFARRREAAAGRPTAKAGNRTFSTISISGSRWYDWKTNPTWSARCAERRRGESA